MVHKSFESPGRTLYSPSPEQIPFFSSILLFILSLYHQPTQTFNASHQLAPDMPISQTN